MELFNFVFMAIFGVEKFGSWKGNAKVENQNFTLKALTFLEREVSVVK